mmetsp:Transcript_65694/g.176046  ORF Transcript_65694/g.176046 Transcript_65694/m.176046 type:complete len:228 (-) Transcript_65694:45-728(-)
MNVDLKYFKSLLGPQYQGDGLLSPLLYTEEAISILRSWFECAVQPFKETHLLWFMRKCSNLSDAMILDIFDILDWSQSGHLRFSEFYFLFSLLAAMQEAQTRLFLFQRNRDVLFFLGAHPATKIASQDEHDNHTVSKFKLVRFLTVFNLHSNLSSQLTELNLKAKRELSEKEVSILLYFVCKQFDMASSQFSTVNEASKQASEAGRSPQSFSSPDSNSAKTKVCSVS